MSIFASVEFHLSTGRALLTCIGLACAYVFSLYVWRKGTTDRDNPETIRRRFISVLVVCAVSPLALWLLTTPVPKGFTLLQLLGLRMGGLITGIFAPLILTAVLFLGPLALQYKEGYLLLYTDPTFWIEAFKDIYWLRSHVMAPLTEEFIFRACMLAVLVPCLGSVKAVFVAPLVFGIAHLHHAYEMLSQGRSFRDTLIVCGFQFLYTTVFGIYCGFIYIRTAHLASVVLVHSFCNHMGFPDFGAVFSFKSPLVRLTLILCFLAGLAGWYKLLGPFTDPLIYHNDIYKL